VIDVQTLTTAFLALSSRPEPARFGLLLFQQCLHHEQVNIFDDRDSGKLLLSLALFWEQDFGATNKSATKA
jgi:hypothetical protein